MGFEVDVASAPPWIAFAVLAGAALVTGVIARRRVSAAWDRIMGDIAGGARA